MHRPLVTGLAALTLWVAPSNAWACTINVHTWVQDDPDDIGLSRREKARREIAMRARLERESRDEMRRWRDEARRGLAGGAPAYAEALVDSIVPPPVTVARPLCTHGYAIYSRYDHYDRAKAAIEAAAGNSPRLSLEYFSVDYGDRVRGCDAEMRGRLAGYVATRTPEATLARIWAEVHRLGFDYSGKGTGYALYYLPLESPFDLRLSQGVPTTGAGGSIFSHRLERETHDRQSERNWARMSGFLSRDPEVQQLVAVLEASLAELSNPAQPYAGLCPATMGPLETFVAGAIDRAKPLKPSVEILFDDPATSGF